MAILFVFFKDIMPCVYVCVILETPAGIEHTGLLEVGHPQIENICQFLNLKCTLM